tara:strand:- start:135 stop:281 length:147 start_codon:yes stop_codon:yes gene_type:complete
LELNRENDFTSTNCPRAIVKHVSIIVVEKETPNISGETKHYLHPTPHE